MLRGKQSFYDIECRLFQEVNSHFDKKYLNLFFRTITRIGGATFTIIMALLLLIFSSNQLRGTAIASALSLSLSHIPVHLIKKRFPRKRPYLIIENTKFAANPLKDHSFPSGHTTAVFSLIIPLVIHLPLLSIALIPLGFSVGISRIYLGLHYPSDVLAGALLGTCFGCLCLLVSS
jgi:undecaprenyl-diphosphatase